MTTARSCQQDEVYAAESTIDSGKRFRSMREVQEFVDDLRETWWWERWLQDVVRVEVVRGSRSATASLAHYDRDERTGLIELVASQPTLRTVLHELAHVFAVARRNSHAHDPWYCRVAVELEYLVHGVTPSQALMLAFTAHGVDYDAGGITDWTRGT